MDEHVEWKLEASQLWGTLLVISPNPILSSVTNNLQNIYVCIMPARTWRIMHTDTHLRFQVTLVTINFVQWCFIFVGPQYRTSFMSTFWHLELW